METSHTLLYVLHILHVLHALHGESVFFLALHEFPDGINFVIHHLLGEAGVGSKEDCLVHDLIGTGHFPHHPKCLRTVFAELDEDGLP